jgi:hypothetical protein
MMIDIVIVAYKRYHEMHVILNSFLAQTRQDFKIRVMHDGYDEKMDMILKQYKNDYPDKIDYEFSQVRYNDWGHSLRAIGITKAESKYILITNDDNYYCYRFLEIMLDELEKKDGDIIYCDMIHGHERPGGRPLPRYSFFKTSPSINNIDTGAFIVKTELAKQVGFRVKNISEGDGVYFEDLLKTKDNINLLKVNQVLFYHN